MLDITGNTCLIELMKTLEMCHGIGELKGIMGIGLSVRKGACMIKLFLYSLVGWWSSGFVESLYSSFSMC